MMRTPGRAAQVRRQCLTSRFAIRRAGPIRVRMLETSGAMRTAGRGWCCRASFSESHGRSAGSTHKSSPTTESGFPWATANSTFSHRTRSSSSTTGIDAPLRRAHWADFQSQSADFTDAVPWHSESRVFCLTPKVSSTSTFPPTPSRRWDPSRSEGHRNQTVASSPFRSVPRLTIHHGSGPSSSEPTMGAFVPSQRSASGARMASSFPNRSGNASLLVQGRSSRQADTFDEVTTTTRSLAASRTIQSLGSATRTGFESRSFPEASTSTARSVTTPLGSTSVGKRPTAPECPLWQLRKRVPSTRGSSDSCSREKTPGCTRASWANASSWRASTIWHAATTDAGRGAVGTGAALGQSTGSTGGASGGPAQPKASTARGTAHMTDGRSISRERTLREGVARIDPKRCSSEGVAPRMALASPALFARNMASGPSPTSFS